MDTDARTDKVWLLSVERKLPWSLESRVRNERRMLGSERGYGRPVVKRPYGARSLLYSSLFSAEYSTLCRC